MKPLADTVLDKGWGSFLNYLERRLKGVATGIPELDDYLLGLGAVVLFQGETGSNKSTLALQILHHQLSLGAAAIMLDCENGQNRIRMRLMCQANRISETDIKVARTSMETLKRYRKPLVGLPLHVYTEPPSGLEEIGVMVDQAMEAYQGRHVVLLVDSVQAMPRLADEGNVSIEMYMGFFDQLKLRHEGRLTILVVSEINRAAYGQEQGLGAGKGSNSLEFKAETVFDMREDKAQPGVIKLKVAKHRDGQKGATFFLKKVMAEESNQTSFVFLLEVADGGDQL
jgi:KaiC/GvpD/RAD55 family RecA-like ATPase